MAAIEHVLSSVVADFGETADGPGFRSVCQEYRWVLTTMLDNRLLERERSKVIDVGAGAGVVSLSLAKLGHQVVAVDTWEEYEPGSENIMGESSGIVARLQRNGVDCLRRDVVADGLGVESESFDLALCLAVIEHLHISPQTMLRDIWRALKPGGHLVLSTPNLARLSKRLGMALGRSIHPALEVWWKEGPFFGHIREYDQNEIVSMLQWAGFEVERTYLTNCGLSPFEGTLRGAKRVLVPAYWAVASAVPGFRHAIVAIARKPGAPAATGPGRM